MHTGQAVIQFTGDALEGRYWTWEIHGSADTPRIAALNPAEVAAVTARLSRALPGGTPAARQTHRQPSADHCALAALDGELTHPAAERDLMLALGHTLLPAELLSDIRGLGSDGMRPQLRISPSPGTTVVPWSLLRTDPETDERLGELVDLVRVAPLLVRDLDGTATSSWDEVSHLPCLHLIDPITLLSDVVPDEHISMWTTNHNHPADCQFEEPVNRNRLSELLLIPRSRFFYIGHAIPNENPASVGLNLGDPAGDRSWLSTPTNQPFTARDLTLGTLGAPDDVGQDQAHNYPDISHRPLPNHRIGIDQLIGREVWPMPNRVALIACTTGSDMAMAEPFGLVTATLEAGAELVTATLWPLLTDYAYAQLAGISTPVLTQLALDIDAAHQRDDIFTALQTWETGRLELWRSTGRPEHSPLSWGAVATYHAPTRHQGNWNSLDQI